MLQNDKGKKFIYREIIEILQNEADTYGIDNIQIFIGTDSHKHKDATHFVTAFVIYRKSKGGRVFYHRIKDPVCSFIRQRMITEAYYSLKLAKEFEEAIPDEYIELLTIPIEIHLDINKNKKYGSNVALKAATGYIQSMGYKCYLKPDATAASTVADKYAH